MAGFYDPRDREDLERVASLLQQAGIEYVLREATGGALPEIHVAEEDIPRAEELLAASRT